MDFITEVDYALVRVRTYLKAKSMDSNADPDQIHTYHNNRVSEKPISLLASDIELIAEAAWRYCDLD